MAIRKARKGAKRTRAPVRTKRRVSSAPRDGQNLICNAYFEAKKSLDPNNEQVMSYTICTDPRFPSLAGATGVTFRDGTEADNGQGALINAASPLAFPKFTSFAALFREYKVNQAQVKVRVDSMCGLENPVITCQDKGESAIVDTMKKALTGAHISHSMSATKRELKYGMKNSGQDRDYHPASGNSSIDAEAKKYIKVFQQMPKGAATDECKHQVQVMLSLTLRDSRNDLN